MQKHAFFEKNQYNTVFAPLPVDREESLYYDRECVAIGYAEDFPLLHYHDRYEVGVCLGGEGLLISGDECMAFKSGDVMFIPPKVKHYSRSLFCDTPCLCRFAYIEASLVKQCFENLKISKNDNISVQIPGVITKNECPYAVEMLTEIFHLCDSDSPHKAAVATMRVAELMLEAPRWFLTLQRPAEAHAGLGSVTSVAEYISLHYSEKLTSADLASLCHLSESQLRRNFSMAYGMPPMAYRNELRMRIAEELLSETDMQVSAIADRLGYDCASDFCRAFKRLRGLSPTEYKRRGRHSGDH